MKDLLPGKPLNMILGLAFLVGLSMTSIYSYLLFHTFVEVFSVLVACGIFIIAWNARRFMDNNYFLFIGIACLFVGLLDILHALAYKNMGVFHRNDADLATQLWVSARYLQSVSFLLAPFFIQRKMKAEFVVVGCSAVTAVFIAAIFVCGTFPECFVEGAGLTRFKIISEYLIVLILLASLALVRTRRDSFDPDVLRLLTISLALLSASELAFTLYTDVFGISNMVGHLLKLCGFFLMYKAVIGIGLTRPFDLLFRELKKSEEALIKERNDLRESEKRYRELYKNTPVMLHSIDRDGRLVNVSNYWLEHLGYSWDEIMGRKSVEVFTEASRRYAEEVVIPQFFRTGHCHEIPYHLVKKNGDVIDVLLTASAEKDAQGEVLRSLAVMIDVTEQKRTGNALRESEEKFRLLAENAQDLIYRFRFLPVPCFEYVSPSATRITGYTPEEHYADPELALKMVHPDDRHLLKEMNFSSEAQSKQFYIRWLRKDGRILWTEQHNKLTFNAEGKVVSIMGIARDVTERKQSEEKIEILNTELASRASELEALNTELEAFNYSVSHDLRAPLSNISGSCEVLLMNMYAEALDEQGKYFVRSIHGQTKRMNHLIEAMLNFSRINRQELCRMEVDLSNMALAISGELKMKQPDRRVAFTIAEGAACHGDPVLLRTVLHNLIGNAWKYTGNQDSADIEFGMADVEGNTVFYIRDNGAGFDPAQGHKLFRPFHRLHASSEFEGFGVGLATVQRIIQRHGGQITAEGEVGKGATFSFTL